MRRLFLAATLAALSAAPLNAQGLRGRLLDAVTGNAIPTGTLVLLTEDSLPVEQVTTGPDGTFLLSAPQPGTYRLQARRDGYLPATTHAFDLADRDVIEVEVRLSTAMVVLKPLTVLAGSTRTEAARSGFHARAQRSAFGTFVTRDQIEERHPLYASDLLRAVAGVHLVPTWWGRSIVVMRGHCVPQVYLDGMRVRTSSIDDLVSPMDLEGVEVYLSAVEAPAEFVFPAGSCGVILLWTRGST